ncbi:hypothetical protein DPMN_085693 [Dreissena polymorpha]|uniref:Uncharacterized protein n=1 Tax=Dreissena polymorpha TaxID=45954 RepID=A0A9D3YGI9_DREPO|nr:hypothetical protein DPMN_085693 [Dreissena polymorpha]
MPFYSKTLATLSLVTFPPLVLLEGSYAVLLLLAQGHLGFEVTQGEDRTGIHQESVCCQMATHLQRAL